MVFTQQLHRWIIAEHLMFWRAGAELLFRGISTGWRNGLTKKLIIFNKHIWRVLQLGWNNPMHYYRLETGWIESNFAEKRTGHQAGQELAVCACDNSTANYILGNTNRNVASRPEKWSFPCAQHLQDHMWRAVFSFGIPSTRRTMETQQDGHGAAAHSVWGEAERTEFVHTKEEKAKGWPYCCLWLPKARVQRRWRQTLLSGALR